MKEFICKNCEKSFLSKKACKSRIPQYCSKSCANSQKRSEDTKSRMREAALLRPKRAKKLKVVRERKPRLRKIVLFICAHCKEEKQDPHPFKGRVRKYCSKTCASEGLKLNKPCEVCGKVIPNEKGVSLRNRRYCGKECWLTIRRGSKLSEEWKVALSEGRKKSEKCKGPNLYNWKGGKKTELARMRVHGHNRRKKITLKLDSIFIKALFFAQKGRCFYCESSIMTGKNLEHLTSIKNGGDNQNYNLVWSCRSCNSKKRSANLEDYAIKTGNIFWIDKWDYIFVTALMLKERYLQNVSTATTQRISKA